MRPTTNSVHVDQVLSNISIKYKNHMYIAENVAPLVPVTNQSDKYYIFNKADDFTDTAEYRAPGTASTRHGFRVSTTPYMCEEIADATVLEDETRDNADSVLRIETAKTNFVTNKVLLKLERIVETLCMTTTNWDNSSTPSNLWDDYVNSDPITDIETAIDTVEDGTGAKVNKMIISNDVWKILKHHPQILARKPNDSFRVARLEDLKAIFEIDDIMIGRASYNTANQGQTASFSRIWSGDVWLGHVTNSPAIEEPSAIYTFVWGRDGGQMRGVRRWRDENVHSDIIEAFMNFDCKVTASDMGYVLEGCIS